MKELTDLKRQKQKLEEENNMLKYKMEVLIGASNPYTDLSGHRRKTPARLDLV